MSLNRRNLLQSVGLGSLGSFWPLSKLAAARPTANVYQQLGVRPVINCMGAWTVIGASRQWPELHAPMVTRHTAEHGGHAGQLLPERRDVRGHHCRQRLCHSPRNARRDLPQFAICQRHVYLLLLVYAFPVIGCAVLPI